MERKTRMPSQKRSIDKYEKVLAAAFKLFNEKGYYNITTADIAKEAGVATGSIYSYFTDKKEIYKEVLKRINEKFYAPTHDFWKESGSVKLKTEENLKSLFRLFIKMMIEYHDFSKLFHDDMMALELLDEDIAAFRAENLNKRNQNTKGVFELIQIPFKDENAPEIFTHYCNLLIEDVCHEILYDSTIKDVDRYIEQTVDMLYKLLQNLAEL